MFYLVAYLILFQVQAQAKQYLEITLIHDDTIELQHPLDSIGIWIEIITENLKFQCESQISINNISVTPATDFSKELASYKDDANRTNAFIILTQCKIVETIIRHLRTPEYNPHIIFLDIMVCQPLKKSEAFHLEAFRFKVRLSYPNTSSYTTAELWLQDTVCPSGLDQKTKNLLNTSISTDLVLVERIKYHDMIDSSEIYQLNSQAEKNYVHRFLNGKQLRVASLEEVPMIIFDRSPLNGSIINCRGFSCSIFHILQERFKFTFTLLAPADGLYGTEMENGSWNGLVRMIVDKEVDVVIRRLSHNYARYQVADFAVHIDKDPILLLVPSSAADDGNFTILSPFHNTTWKWILSVIILLPLILWIYERTTQLIQHKLARSSLADFFIFTYKVLLGQSIGRRIRRVELLMTLLMIGWGLCAMVLSNAYTGNLLSHQLVRTKKMKINSLTDLLASSLNCIVRRGTSTETLFLDAREEETNYWRIGEILRHKPLLLLEPGPDREKKIQNLVLGGKHAYIGASSSTTIMMEDDYHDTKQCRLTLAKKTISDMNVGYLLRKNSPLTSIFNMKLLQIQQSGLDIYWFRRNRPLVSVKETCKFVQSSQGETKLSLDSFRSTFYILGFGLTLATAAFILEILLHLLLRHEWQNLRFA